MVIVNDKAVEFRCYAPGAKDVRLVGDFTGWRCGDVRMQPLKNGYWTARVTLNPGIFHFRYLIDGAWHTDEATANADDGPFGVDSVLWVLPGGRYVHARPCRLAAGRGADARLGLPAPQSVRAAKRMLAS